MGYKCQPGYCLALLLITSCPAFASYSLSPITHELIWVGFQNFIYKTNSIHKVYEVYVNSTMESIEHL